MGRKRKATSAILNEDKTLNACPETTTSEMTINLPIENSNAMEAMNAEIKVQPNSNVSPRNKKNASVTNVVIRRSSRRTNSVLQTRSQDSKPVVEHVINLVENEKEETPHRQQVSTLPIASEKNLGQETPRVSSVRVVNERKLEEKVDYLVQAVDEFKSKFNEETNGGPSSDFSYKSLYIDSQKKIDALMEDKVELVKELEYARGQIAAYEKMNNAMCARKEVMLVSSLGRATEDIVHLSPQTVQNCIVPTTAAAEDDHETSPKRKKKNYSKKKAKP